MSTIGPRELPTLRLHFILLAVALLATVGSGVYLRLELLTPEPWEVDGSLYQRLLGAHLLWAFFGVCLPLPTALVFLAQRLGAGAPRASSAVTIESRSVRAADAMLKVGVGCQAVASLVLIVPFFASDGSPSGLIAVPIMTLGVLLLGGGLVVRAVVRPGHLRPVPLAALGLSLLAVLLWAAPCAVGVLVEGADDHWMGVSGLIGTLREVGVYAIVAPTAVALAWELVARAVEALGASRRGGSDTARLGLGLTLIALIALAASAKLYLLLGEADLHLADSYWQVGAAHGLLGGPAIVLLVCGAMPSPGSSAVVWLLVASGLSLVAATGLELLLGLSGMPTSYWQYSPEFQARHVWAGAAWLAAIVLVLVAMLVFASRRRDRLTAEEFS